ncbi:MAG: zinc ribbon domain-containing protein [Haloplanus sp.]
MTERRRIVIATVVSIVGSVLGVAGVGHAYLREWRRAFAWFAFVLGAGLLLVVVFADPQTATPSTLPRTVTIPLVALFALNTLDAYRVASRGRRNGTTDVRCPACGRECDPALAFCPWCAESFEEKSE